VLVVPPPKIGFVALGGVSMITGAVFVGAVVRTSVVIGELVLVADV
jgi:hypothetical protein